MLGDAGVIGFACAMPMELRPLRRRLRLRRTDDRLYRGSLDGRPVVATVTGMGTALARAGATRLLDAAAVDRVVVVGITGALENGTPIGTLVVPEQVVDHATGRAHRPAPIGSLVPHGTMRTTDELITGAGDLAALRSQGVVSLDMETAAIAEVCEGRGVPWSVVRAISDRASDGSVDEEIFRLSHQDGSPDGRAVVRYLLRHPGRVPHLARLGRQSTRAASAAARAAVDALTEHPTQP